MAQITETKMAAMADKMSGLLSALKAGVDACGGKGDLFANLLAETKSALPEVEAYGSSPSGSYESGEQPSRRPAAPVSCEKGEAIPVKTQGRASVQQPQKKEAPSSNNEKPAAPTQEAAPPSHEEATTQSAATGAASQIDDASDSVADDKDDKTDPLDKLDELMALLALIAPLDGKAAQVAADDAPLALNDGQGKATPMTMDESLTEAQKAALAALAQIQKEISAEPAQGEEGDEAASTQEGMNVALKEIASNILTLKEYQKGGKPLMTEEGAAEGLIADEAALAEGGQKEAAQSGAGASAATATQGSSAQGKGGDLYAMGFLLKGEAMPAATTTASGMVATALATTAKESGDAATGSALKAASGTGAATTTAPLVGEGLRSAGSYDFASQLSAARVNKGGAAGLPQAVEQVSVQLHKAVKEGLDEITIQLKPAELGKIEIKLSVSADKSVTGTVVAENQATLTLLQKDSSSLQRALQEAGLQAQAGCMEFSLRDQGNAQQFAQNKNEGFSRGKGADDEAYSAALEASTSQPETYYVTPGHVNLRV